MNKSKIIYVFDPMCGWCYGFGKVMNEFKEKHQSTIDFDIISGGMVVGEREGPVGDFADYILGAYKRVEEYSGIKFGEAYLKELRTKKLWSSSVTPAIAVEVFKHFKPNDAIAFAHQVQQAYYVDGLDLRNDEVYKELIKSYDINETDFLTKLRSQEFKQKTTDTFGTVANWGISGYPAVILVHNQKYYAIAKGYTDLQTLTKNMQQVLAK